MLYHFARLKPGAGQWHIQFGQGSIADSGKNWGVDRPSHCQGGAGESQKKATGKGRVNGGD